MLWPASSSELSPLLLCPLTAQALPTHRPGLCPVLGSIHCVPVPLMSVEPPTWRQRLVVVLMLAQSHWQFLGWTLILQVVCSLQAAFGDLKANFWQLDQAH